MALRIALAALALALFAGCSSEPTQIIVEVRSDLNVPDRLDRLTVRMVSPDGREQTAEALLGPGQIPLPRLLGVVHEGGALGPFETTVTGFRAANEVVSRRGELTFEAGRTRLWVVDLSSACVGVTCGDEETCADGACRPVTVSAEELLPWDNREINADAGVQCVDELCNERDDDCDGNTDEGFDTQTDDANCGACGVRCDAVPNATSMCDRGACAIVSCSPGFDDCNDEPGCETPIDADPANCGGCGMRCGPPERECCGSMCARTCP